VSRHGRGAPARSRPDDNRTHRVKECSRTASSFSDRRAAIGLAVFSLGLGALLALSKSKKHFIGLTWDDGGKKGGLALQADKNDYRGLLAGLEGITGKKAVDSDSMNVKN